MPVSARNDLTAADVRVAFLYDPMTGILTWRRRLDVSKRWNTRFSGKVAGHQNGDGALRVVFRGQCYLVHRIIWLYVTGSWPESEVDHCDMDRTNNRWGNLREATKSQNAANTRIRATNRSGWKGVSWNKVHKHWQARLMRNGKLVLAKSYDCPAAAHLAYAVASAQAFGQFARSM